MKLDYFPLILISIILGTVGSSNSQNLEKGKPPTLVDGFKELLEFVDLDELMEARPKLEPMILNLLTYLKTGDDSSEWNSLLVYLNQKSTIDVILYYLTQNGFPSLESTSKAELLAACLPNLPRKIVDEDTLQSQLATGLTLLSKCVDFDLLLDEIQPLIEENEGFLNFYKLLTSPSQSIVWQNVFQRLRQFEKDPILSSIFDSKLFLFVEKLLQFDYEPNSKNDDDNHEEEEEDLTQNVMDLINMKQIWRQLSLVPKKNRNGEKKSDNGQTTPEDDMMLLSLEEIYEEILNLLKNLVLVDELEELVGKNKSPQLQVEVDQFVKEQRSKFEEEARFLFDQLGRFELDPQYDANLHLLIGEIGTKSIKNIWEESRQNMVGHDGHPLVFALNQLFSSIDVPALLNFLGVSSQKLQFLDNKFPTIQPHILNHFCDDGGENRWPQLWKSMVSIPQFNDILVHLSKNGFPTIHESLESVDLCSSSKFDDDDLHYDGWEFPEENSFELFFYQNWEKVVNFDEMTKTFIRLMETNQEFLDLGLILVDKWDGIKEFILNDQNGLLLKPVYQTVDMIFLIFRHSLGRTILNHERAHFLTVIQKLSQNWDTFGDTKLFKKNLQRNVDWLQILQDLKSRPEFYDILDHFVQRGLITPEDHVAEFLNNENNNSEESNLMNLMTSYATRVYNFVQKVCSRDASTCRELLNIFFKNDEFATIFRQFIGSPNVLNLVMEIQDFGIDITFLLRYAQKTFKWSHTPPLARYGLLDF